MTDFERLKTRLLSFGGTEVQPPCCEEHESLHPGILERGQLRALPFNVQLLDGEKGDCHSQAGRLSYNTNNELRLYCGYALANPAIHETDDRSWGVWVVHSWCEDPEDGTIYETTGNEYEAYYGISGYWEPYEDTVTNFNLEPRTENG